jgi:S-adenosylmethionine:tRNA ribosyltransferase-isomerase
MGPEPSTAAPRTSDFEYELPAELIADRPAMRRDESRLLVLHRSAGTLDDRAFRDLPEYLSAGDAMALNDTRVFPARLLGRKPTGAPAEILLLRPLADDAQGRSWEALVRPGGKLKPGRVVEVGRGFRVRIDDSIPGGGRRVTLDGEGDPWELVERHGQVPLPPYIGRDSDEQDRTRYQTVYARHRGSVAAPTAGLHFTEDMLREVEARGVHIVRITLHVGVGTFRPVDAERPEDHALHSEHYSVSEDSARALNEARACGGRVWAVGTTSARTLETVVDQHGEFHPGAGWTDLFIHPPYRFQGVDGLLTNFHLPRSSLLMLVTAFGGLRQVLGAYEHAIGERYRFYSYGDAMLVT